MEKNAKYILEYDFYGALLTKRQQEVMELYHEENYTLQEIGEEFGISRQGVHDTLKNAEIQLDNYEEKLGLLKRFQYTKNGISIINNEIDKLIALNKENTGLAEHLEKIKRALIALSNV